MKKIVKLFILSISMQLYLMPEQLSTQVNVASETAKLQPAIITKPKASLKEALTIAKLFPIQKTLFVNGRVNDILLIITDNKNKQYQVTIKMGKQYESNHEPQELKKVVCCEKLTQNTTLTQADLNNYSVFVFNTDQKLEKYHFLNVQQKNLVLKKARQAQNDTLFNEISDQNIYNP